MKPFAKLVLLGLAFLLVLPGALQSEESLPKNHQEERGRRGPRGHRGRHGKHGARGVQGVQGSQGVQGAQGNPGEGAPAGYLSRHTFVDTTIFENQLLPFSQDTISPPVNITPSVDSTTFTITEAGVYQVSLGIVVSNRQLGDGIVTLYQNGATAVSKIYVPVLLGVWPVGVPYPASCSAIITAVAGDTITVAWSPTEVGMTLSLSSINESTSDWITISRLTPGSI
jgi:hypothetical protein